MNKSSIKRFLIVSLFGITCNQNLVEASTKALPIVTRETKCDLSPEMQAEAKKTSLSILKPTDANKAVLYQSYPDGSLLFPNNPDIAAPFNSMIGAIKKNADLIEFFRKINITSLNQLYNYLIKIYANLNLINPGCSQDTEIPTANQAAYLIDEATYNTNKKKLIVNHFINLIQYQFGSSISSYIPSAPEDLAVTLGKLFIQNDYGLNLADFTTAQTDPKIIASQTVYIDFLKLYINFFQTYTNYLSKIDANGVNQYYTIAQSIYKFLNPNGKDQSATLTNPPMFFYDAESMRSIQFIPFVAGTIPAKSQLIPWAPVAVNAAVKNIATNGHAVAFFTDIADKKTQNQSQAEHVYILAETGPALFQQELLAQPSWLNNQEGCIRILRGCLGDFSALVGTGIIDAKLEGIIQKAMPAVKK